MLCGEILIIDYLGIKMESTTTMMHRMQIRFIFGIVLMVFLVGCGRSSSLTEVSGTAVFAGQPVETGTIAFYPENGKGPTAAGVIIGGHYQLNVAPGQKRVAIEAFHITGRRHFKASDPNSPMVDIREQILPERYNTKTELACEVTSAARTHDFVLEKSPTK